MALCITRDDLTTLDTINGVPIGVLEKRGRPLEDKTKDPDGWRSRSWSGFLGEKESLRGLLESDWDTVRGLGTTHIELASHLKAILCLVKKSACDDMSDVRDCPVTYEPLSLDSAAITSSPSFHIPPNTKRRLHVTRSWYCGKQRSFLWNDDAAQGDGVRSVDNQEWQVEYAVRDPETGLELMIGGDDVSGVLSMIERYGFYEGGGFANVYRVDPVVIAYMVSGVCTQATVDLVEGRAKWDEENMVVEERALEGTIAEKKVIAQALELQQLQRPQAPERLAKLLHLSEEICWLESQTCPLRQKNDLRRARNERALVELARIMTPHPTGG
eukprot:TRINITY_DN924_c0_g1_i1.p1 TRINITY_DN924_c0_g1~~TRINITY_DN924_c0_g1_i1.p1  ORF type:complete len:329 (+),score=51.10 TRINITY_DN924_c0_g1_i1:410-1396(+)